MDFIHLDSMNKVQAKLLELQEDGQEVSETDLICDVVKANAQFMADQALEGSYWMIQWEETDKVLAVYDVLKNKIGELNPNTSDTFSQSFRANAMMLLHTIDVEINQLVKQN